MSIIFNQNQNSLSNNQEIQMGEPNADNQFPNVEFNLERRQVILRVDPNSLLTNLMNQGLGTILLRSKGNTSELSVIEQIMKKVDELSTLLSKVVIDIQEQFTFLEGKLHFYVEGNNKRVNSNEDSINKIATNWSKFLNNFNAMSEKVKTLEEFKNETSNNIKAILNGFKELNDKQNESDTKIKKVEEILSKSNINLGEIKIENKNDIKDVVINEYENNLNNKVLKFKMYQKYNSIYINDITKDCEEENKEKELADKVKIIFKKDKNTEKSITYEISTIGKDWDFSRHMKNIMRRVSRARNFKRINFRNLDYVFKLKWSSKQIQFEKIKATQRFINNNSFFVKIKNAYIFIKRRFQSKINQFRFNNYNKNFNQNSLGKFYKNGRNNNMNCRRNNNQFDNRSFNNNRKFNNNRRFYNKRRFNNNRNNNNNNNNNFNNNNNNNNNNNFNNNRSNNINNNQRNAAVNQVLRLLPQILGPRGQNFRY